MSYRDFPRNSRYNDGTTWFRADHADCLALRRSILRTQGLGAAAFLRKITKSRFWVLATTIQQGRIVRNKRGRSPTIRPRTHLPWTKTTGMQDLGTLSGDVASVSISINDAGAVVGASLDATARLS
jgi:hypothetical protein